MIQSLDAKVSRLQDSHDYMETKLSQIIANQERMMGKRTLLDVPRFVCSLPKRFRHANSSFKFPKSATHKKLEFSTPGNQCEVAATSLSFLELQQLSFRSSSIQYFAKNIAEKLFTKQERWRR